MVTDRTASAGTARIHRSASALALVASLIVAAATILVGKPAQAVLVGVIPNVVPNTSVNPASYPGWTQGDPGWGNAAHLTFANGVYLKRCLQLAMLG